MRLRVLGCYGGEAPGCHQISLLVDGHLLLDAGSVTAVLHLDAQARIDYVLISHAHLDHVAALAFLADNVSTMRRTPIEVWSIPPVIRQLKKHVFNGSTWPDFTKIPSGHPILSLHEIRKGEPTRVGKYQVVAVGVHHAVAATGYLISDGKSSILYGGDSGPTEDLWKAANAAEHLQAIVVEASFPNRLHDLAKASGHFTPNTLREELKKLRVDVPVFAQHMKPHFIPEIVAELAKLSDPPVTPLKQGKQYTF